MPTTQLHYLTTITDCRSVSQFDFPEVWAFLRYGHFPECSVCILKTLVRFNSLYWYAQPVDLAADCIKKLTYKIAQGASFWTDITSNCAAYEAICPSHCNYICLGSTSSYTQIGSTPVETCQSSHPRQPVWPAHQPGTLSPGIEQQHYLYLLNLKNIHAYFEHNHLHNISSCCLHAGTWALVLYHPPLI